MTNPMFMVSVGLKCRCQLKSVHINISKNRWTHVKNNKVWIQISYLGTMIYPSTRMLISRRSICNPRIIYKPTQCGLKKDYKFSKWILRNTRVHLAMNESFHLNLIFFFMVHRRIIIIWNIFFFIKHTKLPAWKAFSMKWNEWQGWKSKFNSSLSSLNQHRN